MSTTTFTATTVALTVLGSLPWVLTLLVATARMRSMCSLADYDDTPPPDAERVSVVLPARNEAEHIAACLASLRRTNWPNVEIIVVDDHSTDGTGALAREAAAGDARVRIIDAPLLPTGWFGKQWACHSGAAIATGSLLFFTDADTRHAPDLIARLVRARAGRKADLISVIGRQALESFWEYAVQPVVFATIFLRYGGTKQLENATRPVDVIANGQCLMLTRRAYELIGGHAAVCDSVAEDLMLAQRTHAAGLRVSIVSGIDQLVTRMYDGLASLVRGWMKNVYAGGRLSMPGGRVGRAIFPFVLILWPLMTAAPFIGVGYVLLGMLLRHEVPVLIALWSALTASSTLIFFSNSNALVKSAKWRAILVPLGAVVFSLICVAAVLRGRTVEWKGRTYRSA